MSRQLSHAAQHTLLGQIQRGRGEGFLRILSLNKRDAWILLADCICNDPRLDGQVEDRAGYYASIAVEIGFELAPLTRHLREHDDPEQWGWNTPLAVDTLCELAKRNHGDAAGILCDYVAWGQWWESPLHILPSLSDPVVGVTMAEAVERRFPSDEKLEPALASISVDETVWAILARHSNRIGALRDALPKSEPPTSTNPSSSPTPPSLTVAEILALADPHNRYKLRKLIARLATPADQRLLLDSVSLDKPFAADVALAGLASLAPDGIFGWLQGFAASIPETQSFLHRRAVEVMVSLSPALTLPFARNRLFHENNNERFVAEKLLAPHAERDDVPILRTALKEALRDDEEFCYRLCNVLEAFAHLPGTGPAPELSDVYLEFRYSYGRTLAAEAISITSPDFFRANFARECLWDCESTTRALGAKSVPLDDRASAARLRQLASDAWEDADSREAARKRLSDDLTMPGGM